ncbi:uncharacterized protein [Venturia canescens]|uniref:uncharacterized protein n=1 Tax=Venturia canescens TaxID=32260 RepID=UPI001C9CC3FD|nr:uncharacterized protein LOC122408452 [Venturia canescens]XP_043287524.1 uncharacterized protein LOC122417792 [Venturia canescens]
MEKILEIQKPIIFDESIAHYELHSHQPFASATFNNNDEIRITVQHQDLCLLPSRSFLHIYGRLTKVDGNAVQNTKLVNNAICHMFEEIRYELNAIEIDRNKNVGLTTLMKNYVSQSPEQMSVMENAGWLSNDESTLIDNDGYFDLCIPLSLILGFAEDYNQIIINAKHELILTRSNNDTNAVVQTPPAEQFKISLLKIEWVVPYIKISDQRKISLLNFIAKDPPIALSFRTWELYEYPLLPMTSKNVWVVKTSTQLEKPRYVIVGFQTARKSTANANASHFDHCNLRDVKLFLNSQCYPYGNLNLDIAHNQFALLYDMYTSFQASYYGKEPEPMLNKADFIKYAPLIVIDCSKQNEFLKSGPVDIRLEFESAGVFPAQTAAYCLILHDRIIEYNPISGNVKKLV